MANDDDRLTARDLMAVCRAFFWLMVSVAVFMAYALVLIFTVLAVQVAAGTAVAVIAAIPIGVVMMAAAALPLARLTEWLWGKAADALDPGQP